MPELVIPTMEYAESYIEALHEGYAFGVMHPKTAEEIQEIEGNIEEHIAGMGFQPGEGVVSCPDGQDHPRVASDTLWLVEGTEFIGAISLRHELTDFLRRWGGHIGYGVRPKYQRQGMGTKMLALCLERAKKLGLEKVMITTDETNIGSQKVIEGNGGVLEKKTKVDWCDMPTYVYWIDLTDISV